MSRMTHAVRPMPPRGVAVAPTPMAAPQTIAQPGATHPVVPALIERLRDALEAHGVAYCQWKGHWDPGRWAVGDGDIDLLVARPDGAKFSEVLASLGFRQAVPVAWRRVPGVLSYFGYEPTLRRLVHVHAHFHVRLGAPTTRNYRLPIERPLIEARESGAFFPTPTPELEFIVFVVRMVLDHSVRASLTHDRGSRRAREWEYLAGRVEQERVRDLLRDHLPALAPSLFDRCVRSLSPGCPLLRRLRVRRELHRALRAHAEGTGLVAAVRRTLRRGTARCARLVGRQRRNQLLTGGAVIAVLGGDGAGKTTAVTELTGWLGDVFDTVRVHLGKPPRSLLTLAEASLRRVVRMARRLAGGRGDGGAWLLPFRSVCIARDRYRLYRRVRRAAARGSIVVCDRYPTTFVRHMDGPNIARMAGAGMPGWLVRRLLRLERACYDRILPPELLIVLRVTPEVAAARKTDEDFDYVLARSRELWELDLNGTPTHVVDADQPGAAVLAQVRAIVWSHL